MGRARALRTAMAAICPLSRISNPARTGGADRGSAGQPAVVVDSDGATREPAATRESGATRLPAATRQPGRRRPAAVNMPEAVPQPRSNRGHRPDAHLHRYPHGQEHADGDAHRGQGAAQEHPGQDSMAKASRVQAGSVRPSTRSARWRLPRSWPGPRPAAQLRQAAGPGGMARPGRNAPGRASASCRR